MRKNARRGLILCVLLIGCKSEEKQLQPTPNKEPARNSIDTAELDAAAALPTPPSEAAGVMDASDSEDASDRHELVIAPQEGFEVEQIEMGGDFLLWNEKGEGPVHRIYRRPLNGGEPERLGEDGRYTALNAIGSVAEVVGETLTATTRGGHWRLSPGKTQKSPMGCFAQDETHCYGIDKSHQVMRWRKAGGKAELVARSIEIPPEAKYPFRWVEVDENGIVFRIVTWRDGKREMHSAVDVITKPGTKPIALSTPHIIAGVGALAAHSGYLYYTYETLGRDGVTEMRRIRGGEEPERIFGGRRIWELYFADDQPLGLYHAKGTKSWFLARLDPGSDAIEVVAEFGERPWDALVHGGYFYFIAGGSIYRLPL